MTESLSTLANGDLLAHVFRAGGLSSYRVSGSSKAAQFLQGIETLEGRYELESVVGQFESLERCSIGTETLAILTA
jgi:hypothetical protein